MQTFTIEEVLQIIKNVGCDKECGACMEVAFCGASGFKHSCVKYKINSCEHCGVILTKSLFGGLIGHHLNRCPTPVPY